jgi:hypothetical protein
MKSRLMPLVYTAVAITLLTVPARADVFVFDPTELLNGVTINARLETNTGDLSTLPSLSGSTYDGQGFGNLVGLYVASDFLSQVYTLFSFQPRPKPGDAGWTIAPGPDINFTSLDQGEEFRLLPGGVQVGSDFLQDDAVISGSWVDTTGRVPEPSVWPVFMWGLLFVFLGNRIKKGASQNNTPLTP